VYNTFINHITCGVSGNPLPKPIFDATAVPFGDSFLIVGGSSAFPISWGKERKNNNTVFRYNPDEDSWTLLDARMKEEKYEVIAMLVDKQMFQKE
jgi:hypothetical protein